MINKIYIVINEQKDNNLKFTNELIDFLLEKNKDVYVTSDDNKICNKCKCVALDDVKNIDLAIILGGDGTIIRASKKLAVHNIPIVGINLGSLGFLADIEQDKYKESLTEIFKGNFVEIRRSMLTAKLVNSITGEVRFEEKGLNDVVIAREGISRMVGFSAYVNDVYVNDYSADGIIVSTSVGSTAYNLSAGGPILAPTSDTIVLTPICPHSLSARSIVLSNKDKIKINFENNRKNWETGIMITVDGVKSVEIHTGEYVLIEKSKYKTTLVSIKEHDFYKSLRYKLKTY